MFAAAAITFRETIEAALVVGVLAALTRGLDRRGAWISLGILAGLAASVAMAVLVGGASRTVDRTFQDEFNAGALLLAVAILHWHTLTAGTRGHEVRQAISKADAMTRSGRSPMLILAVVSALAVFREGTETVLFVYGLLAGSGRAAVFDTGLGVAAGLGVGTVLAGLVYVGLVRLPTRSFFAVVNTLMAVLAAAMAAQAVVLLQRAGLATALQHLAWDTSSVLPQDGLLGRLLHMLVGYAEQPSILQVVVYGSVLATMALAAVWGRRRAAAFEARAIALPLWRYEASRAEEAPGVLGRTLLALSAGLWWVLLGSAVISLSVGSLLFVSAAHDADQVVASWLLLGGSLLLIMLQTLAWWRAARA